MIQTVRKAWGIPELRKKIIFTLLILLIFRAGNAIMVPYINRDALALQMQLWGTGLLGLYNVMSGGAFATATVFALGVQPYINSSIIVQLLTVAIPSLERLARDGGEEGKKKIQSITRYATVAIAILQAVGYYFMMKNYNLLGQEGIWPALVIIVTLIAGSSFVMWMGEQVTEFGVGNGISIILFAGILSRIPNMVSGMVDGVQKWSAIKAGTMTLESLTSAGYTETQAQAYLNGALAPWAIVLLVVGILALIAFIVFINDAERRHSCAVRQASGGPQDVRRSEQHPAYEGEYVRRSADHLRSEHRLSAHHCVDLHRYAQGGHHFLQHLQCH